MDDRAAEDRMVVRETLEGDQQVFAKLVARYQKLVQSAAWRYGTAREEIEDVVSEVFIKAYQNLHRYRPDHPFSTWLYRLAVNHVVDHGRRKRRERGRTEMPQELRDPGPGPRERVEANERAALVRGALEELKPRYREALFLVYVEGLRVEEVARTLSLPSGTVKSRLKRGRDALRELLADRHPEFFGGRDAL